MEICKRKEIEELSGRNIFICTDSQAAIKAVRAAVVDSKMVLECKDSLNFIGDRNKVTVLWVPSHTEIAGNERADELAGQGAEHHFIGPEPRFGISKTTRKRIAKAGLSAQHQRDWINYEGGKHTKIFCKIPNEYLSKNLLDLSRPNIKRVVEVITNHCSLNKHLFDIGYEDSPMCSCGLEEETGSHLIGNCPKYHRIRTVLLGKPEISLAELTLDKLDLQRLVKFLNSTRRMV